VKAEAYLSQAVQQGPELSLARRALILIYLRSGQPVKAMATLVPGLRRNVVDPELFSLAGEVYLQNGDPKKAEDYFAQAARQTPKDPQKRTALALAHLLNGSTESVFDELAAISSSDVDATADLALISVHLRRQEIDKALAAIDRLEMKQPGMPLASNLRGRALLLKQEFSGARKSFEKSVTINPAYFPAVASLAALDMNEKKPEEAKKRFQSLLVKNPSHLQALLALAEISARMGGTKEEIAELLRKAIAAHPTDMVPRLLMGDLYLRFSDLKAALVVAQDAVIAIPESPTALDALGRALQALGDYDQAIVTYQKLAEMQPHSPQPHLRIAEVYMLTKNREAVSRSLRRALEIAPDLLKAQSALYALAVDSKAYTDALALARLVQNKRPTNILGYAMEGNVYALQQNWSSAISVYRAGLKRVNSSELAIKLHTILLAHGDTSEAKVFASAWQKNNPKDGYFLSYLGDISLARKDYVNAETAYANVVKVQPNNAVALNNLAWVSAKLSKKEAISYAEKANALLPNQPAFMDTLSMLLLDHGSYEKAEEIQRKAVDIQPLNPSLKLNLAKIHIKTGKINLAKKELNDLAKLGDQFSAQAEVALLLRRL
jgi:cellulose synthase operon protein C